MRNRIISGAIITILMFGGAFNAHAAATSSKNASAGSFNMNSISDTVSGWFASSSKLAERAMTPNTASNSLFQNINNWFRSVSGIGLDQILLAAWRLLLWILAALFNLIWQIALWIMSLVGIGK